VRFSGAHVAQVAENLLFFAGILAGQMSQRIGDDVAVVQILHGGIAPHIHPQAMHQLHVVRAECGRVRPDKEDLDVAARADDIEVELAFGLGQRLPGLTHVKGLILRGHGAG